jgi:hypothetical protein
VVVLVEEVANYDLSMKGKKERKGACTCSKQIFLSGMIAYFISSKPNPWQQF